jgi:hypothetical protein
MASSATSWTGSAVVNGLMAIILLAWLADAAMPSQTPQSPTKAEAAEPVPTPRVRPVEQPARINLPPPPLRRTPDATRDDAPAPAVTRRVVPLQPSIDRKSKPPVKIVVLRPQESKKREPKTPVPKPLRPLVNVKPDPVPNEPTPEDAMEVEADTDAFAEARAKAKAIAEDRAREAAQAAAKARAEARAQAQQNPKSDIEVSVKAARTGRQLLRILEHGKGPAIEIAWPGSSAQRERLQGVLKRCYGMRIALIDRAGRLFRDEGPRGRKWHVDLDRFSGFVRRPNGHITVAERRDARRVARYHQGVPASDPVRIFPRAADAALLGGLAQLLGGDYQAAKTITASYRLQGLRVTVGDLRIDGRRVAGRIDLSRGAAAACRGTG